VDVNILCYIFSQTPQSLIFTKKIYATFFETEGVAPNVTLKPNLQSKRVFMSFLIIFKMSYFEQIVNIFIVIS
jgi:hypothetical protein